MSATYFTRVGKQGLEHVYRRL